MRKTISILGCGWLGTALGAHYTSSGWIVKGSSASQDGINFLEKKGIDTYYIKVNPDSVEVDYMNFFNTDVMVISLPPQRLSNIQEIYPKQINQVIGYIRKMQVPKVVFISSTSVYRNNNSTVQESDAGNPDKPVGNALLEAEQLLLDMNGINTTVIRFGGLIGSNRNPAQYLANKKDVPADAPVNLIHRKDCVNIISEIIQQDKWGKVYNACSPQHPTKKEFYTKAAQISNLPIPGFTIDT